MHFTNQFMATLGMVWNWVCLISHFNGENGARTNVFWSISFSIKRCYLSYPIWQSTGPFLQHGKTGSWFSANQQRLRVDTQADSSLLDDEHWPPDCSWMACVCWLGDVHHMEQVNSYKLRLETKQIYRNSSVKVGWPVKIIFGCSYWINVDIHLDTWSIIIYIFMCILILRGASRDLVKFHSSCWEVTYSSRFEYVQVDFTVINDPSLWKGNQLDWGLPLLWLWDSDAYSAFVFWTGRCFFRDASSHSSMG